LLDELVIQASQILLFIWIIGRYRQVSADFASRVSAGIGRYLIGRFFLDLSFFAKMVIIRAASNK
jgi:hypothetical protein